MILVLLIFFLFWAITSWIAWRIILFIVRKKNSPKNQEFSHLKKNIRFLVTIVLILLSGIFGLAILVGSFFMLCSAYDYWQGYSFFSENFKTPFYKVEHFESRYYNDEYWEVWVSFTYGDSFALRHPENYHDASCNPYFIKYTAIPFVDHKSSIEEIERHVLPQLKCKEASIPDEVTGTDGKPFKYNIHAHLIHNPQTHQVFFEEDVH